jgi:hypothetical protein
LSSTTPVVGYGLNPGVIVPSKSMFTFGKNILNTIGSIKKSIGEEITKRYYVLGFLFGSAQAPKTEL